MSMLSRADEDWQGCESGADYFFANIYDPTPNPAWEKKKAIWDYLDKMNREREKRFPRRYAFDSREYQLKLKSKKIRRFYNQLKRLKPKKFVKNGMQIYDFRADKKHKFSTELYEKGFCVLRGSYNYLEELDPVEDNVIVEVPDDCEWVKIHAVFHKHPCRSLIIPTETYRFVDPIVEHITRKKYKIVGFERHSVRILRVSLVHLFNIYDDEKPELFVEAADVDRRR